MLKIREKRIRLLRKIARLEDAHDRQLAKLNSQLHDLQLKCNHRQTRYCADPAGGFDSYYECVLCKRHL